MRSILNNFSTLLRSAALSAALLALPLALPLASRAQSQAHSASPANSGSPIRFDVYDRTRIDTWQWFAAPPYSETYDYTESLLRLSLSQRIHHWDWQLELAQPAMLGLPTDSISSNAAQGQLGLGGTYYGSNGNNNYPAAAFFKQGYLRYHFGPDKTLRLGRFEFFEGQEMQPKDSNLAWIQTNRVAQRLIGNFGFTNAQRSFDGIDAHYGQGAWDVTAMAGRADQGVFNMNGNPELNVDIQYLAYSRFQANNHLLWRVFGIGYHDGRTGVLKTDNRPLPVRTADHHNIRLGTYGADLLTSFQAGHGKADFMAWGVLQSGNWGAQSDSANAVAVEGGYQLNHLASTPWLRAGYYRGSGDNNPSDNNHNTFFQILPTPRVYARTPFFNLMNNQDTFVQIIDRPAKKLELRSDLRWLKLVSSSDLWYLSGGAFDNKVFGYVGRPSNNASSLATFSDISADWQTTHNLAVNFYYGHAMGKSVIGGIYPVDRNLQFGYVECVYRWGVSKKTSPM